MEKQNKELEEKLLKKFHITEGGNGNRGYFRIRIQSKTIQVNIEKQFSNKEKKQKALKEITEVQTQLINKHIEQIKQAEQEKKEKIKEKDRQHYKDNKEAELERRKIYRENNKEKIKEQRKQYYEKNRTEKNQLKKPIFKVLRKNETGYYRVQETKFEFDKDNQNEIFKQAQAFRNQLN